MNIYKRLLTICLTAIFTLGLSAQTEERKWNVGIHGGAEQYNGDLGNGFYNFSQALYGFGGLSVSRYLSPHFDVTLNGSLGEIGHVENANKFRASMMQVNISGKYSFFKYEDVAFRPYVFVGVGNLYFEDKNNSARRTILNRQLPNFGAGVSYKVSPIVNIVFQEVFMRSDYDNIDTEVKGGKDLYLQHSIGVTFNLGKAKDTDGDGITDNKDVCPKIAGLEKFNGCPDADEDGIADNVDACPTVFGIQKFNGCPDSDGDGITDAEDSCPTEKGLKEFNGCPDMDGDGIADKDDACPKEKGLEEFNGCPDSDGDGIADKDDACPNKVGSKEMGGCPDTDSDGVADNKDLCPDVAGIAKNKGCPEVKKEELAVLKEALYGIKFELGKATITANSYTILENVFSIMNKTPAYKLRIEGHTDAQGSDEANLKLSNDRAASVRTFLINKGISEDRITSLGFGEEEPVATNDTKAGRAQNRRVELEIEF